MPSFQGTFETPMPSFISAFSICMTVPLSFSIFFNVVKTVEKTLKTGYFLASNYDWKNVEKNDYLEKSHHQVKILILPHEKGFVSNKTHFDLVYN